MPSATTTKAPKSTMAGVKANTSSKRKDYPVREKGATDRDTKKPRIAKSVVETKPLKSALKAEKPKSKSKPAKVVEAEPNDSDSDSDGGAPLESSDAEEAVGPEDGLHPDRLQAVITNSTLSQWRIAHKS